MTSLLKSEFWHDFLKKDLKLILLIPTHFEASTQTSDIRMKKRSTALCGTNEIILMRNSVDHQFHIPYPTKFELHLSLSFKVAQKNMTNGEAFQNHFNRFLIRKIIWTIAKKCHFFKEKFIMQLWLKIFKKGLISQ